MKPAIYGDTYREFIFVKPLKRGNLTNITISNEEFKWTMYQYGSCTLFVVVGCIVLCPLLQRRNYKSKQRRKILIIDGLSLLFCLIRTVTLLFSYEQNHSATAAILFFWAVGTTFFVTALAVFLFILWSTTKLEPMIWRFRNTLAIAAIVASNLVTTICKELTLSFSYAENIHIWMVNLLLSSSIINDCFYLGLGICFCGTFKKMTRNRRPSIKLVKERAKVRFRQKRTKIVHTDIENFQSMIRKLRLIAFLVFMRFAVDMYINIKIMVTLNSPKNSYNLHDWEIFAVECTLRMIEILIISMIFCVGFFSPQHKEAAKQWIRNLSLTRSHEELSTRRTNSVDSGRDTASDGKLRAETLEMTVNEYMNEGTTENNGNSSATARSLDYALSDFMSASLTKQDAHYLMVPMSLPISTDIGETTVKFKSEVRYT